MPDILTRIDIHAIPINEIVLTNSLIAAICSAYLMILIIYNKNIIVRVAFITAVGFNTLLQWPSSILSYVIYQHLQSATNLFYSSHVFSIGLILWLTVTSRLYVSRTIGGQIIFSNWEILLSVLISLVAVAIYLGRVPFDCTALYAIIYDPELTLLAREVSIKLAGSAIATMSYGAFANTLAPIAVTVVCYTFVRSIYHKRLIRLMFFAIIIILLIFGILLSGAKALLLPSLIVVSMAAFVASRSLIHSAVTVAVSLLLIAIALLTFEILKDRPSKNGRNYAFGQCAVTLSSCQPAATLITSLYGREGSLGISAGRRDALLEELSRSCHGKISPERLVVPEERPAPPPPDRNILLGILYRGFIVPSQVAAWHFMYMEEEEVDGRKGMPFARRLLGESINIPELVYQKYGSEFAGGDKTSTSTSPTTFILSYPAYLGAIGIFIALIAVMLTDIIMAVLLSRVSASIAAVGAGLAAVISFNFMLSDFVTVMLSHGGLAAIGFLVSFAILRQIGTYWGRRRS